MKLHVHLLLLVSSMFCFAETYQVGPTRTYETPNALYRANVLQDGDTIEIDAGTYSGEGSSAYWKVDNLTIKGVGGRPHMIAHSTLIQGKGIWLITGNNITVDNIEFSGAKVPDDNGSGIRFQAQNITIRNCYFHHNENGILGGNSGGHILIEHCEFGYNGYGDGYSHNLYIGKIDELIFKHNYSHHCNIGQTLKSRANKNYIFYNRFSDEETGITSRLIDISEGGYAIIKGNIFMQGTKATNGNIIGYGPEGLTNPGPHKLYVINNTLVNKRSAGRFLDIQDGTEYVHVANNIFAGKGYHDGTIDLNENNILETDITKLKFKDEANFDYRLLEGSPAIDAGKPVAAVDGNSLTPEYSYLHNAKSESRTLYNNIMDIGGYEYSSTLSVSDFELVKFDISPNPTTDWISIDTTDKKIATIVVYNTAGQQLQSRLNSEKINISQLPDGLYLVKIIFEDGTSSTQSVIKK